MPSGPLMKAKRVARAIAAGVVISSSLSACGGTEPVVAPQPTSRPSERVVATVGMGASLAAPPDGAAELLSDGTVDLMVEGRVSRIEYRYVDDAVASTGLTISVDRARGHSPSELTSWELGGLIPVGELPEFQRDKMFRGRDVGDDALVDFAPAFGAEHAEVGDQVVLFLKRVATGPTAGDYTPLSDAMGRFVRNQDGVYERAGTATDGSDTREVLDPVLLEAALTG